MSTVAPETQAGVTAQKFCHECRHASPVGGLDRRCLREPIVTTTVGSSVVPTYPNCGEERAPNGRCANGQHFDKKFIIETVVARLPIMEHQFEEWKHARDERRRKAWEYTNERPVHEEYDPYALSSMEKWLAIGTVAAAILGIWFCFLHARAPY